MFRLSHKCVAIMSVVVLFAAAFLTYGCGSVSSDSMNFGAGSENSVILKGNVRCGQSANSGLYGTSLLGCEVWPESNSSEKVKTDSDGNFQIVTNCRGAIRLVARLSAPDGVYIGRSKIFSVAGGLNSSTVPVVELNKGTDSCSFKLRDARGNLLTDSSVRPTVWGIPALYDRLNNVWVGPALPANAEKEIKISGNGFKEFSIPLKYNSKSLVFDFTCIKNNETGVPPYITSVSSSDGNPLNTDFSLSGLRDLNLSVTYGGGVRISSCSWDDHGLGKFMQRDEGPGDFGRSSVVWRPSSQDSVGTLTFSVSDAAGLSSSVDIGINSYLSGSVAPVPPSSNEEFSVAFGMFDEVGPAGLIYNPTRISMGEAGDDFKVKLSINGVSDPSMLKKGKVKGSVIFEGCTLLENGDESPEGVLTERVYSLHKPSTPGLYTIKAIVEDKQGRKVSASYDLHIDEIPGVKELSVSPDKTCYSKSDSIEFCAYANDANGSEAIKFSWFISNTKVFEETKGEISSIKVSKFTWNNACSVMPLNENLPDGKYIVKCVVTDSKGNTTENQKEISLSEGIIICFLEDSVDPPRFNPTYREEIDIGYFDLKALVTNRLKEDITVKWDFSFNGEDFLPLPGTPNAVNYGLGCTVAYTVGAVMFDPGTYTFRITVSDKNGRTDSANMKDMYVDGEPMLDSAFDIVQEGKEITPRFVDNSNQDPADPVMPDVIYFIRSNEPFAVHAQCYDKDLNDPLAFKWEMFGYEEIEQWNTDDADKLIYSKTTVVNNKLPRKLSCFTVPAHINENNLGYGEGHAFYTVKCTVQDMTFKNPDHRKFLRVLILSGVDPSVGP